MLCRHRELLLPRLRVLLRGFRVLRRRLLLRWRGVLCDGLALLRAVSIGRRCYRLLRPRFRLLRARGHVLPGRLPQ
jgi:hypothetical protein